MSVDATTQDPVTIQTLNASARIKLGFWILAALGLATIMAGIAGWASQRIWQAYLVNFVFWSGVAQAGVVFSAAYRMTNGRWGESIRHIAEGFIAFVPLSILFFLLTILGRNYLWPWIQSPLPEKAVWLNTPFFFARVTAYLCWMSIVSVWYVYYSIRPELGRLRETGALQGSYFIDWLTRNWRGVAVEEERCGASVRKLVPLVLLSYAVVYSLIGFDVVMSLDPHWTSTLFGWLHFIHCFFAGISAVLICALLVRMYSPLGNQITSAQLYDSSRLLMGISMLSGGFYWAQYLVLWYGNLGDEIGRLIIRFHRQPWQPVQWTVIGVLYFFPLAVFLSKSIKTKPRLLLFVASIIYIGVWLYQFIEIAPSIWKGNILPLGLEEVALFLGFSGVFGLCWLAYARIVPLAGDIPPAAHH